MKSMKRGKPINKSMANLVDQVEDTCTSGTKKKQRKIKQEKESKKMLKPKKLSNEGKAGTLTRTKSTMLHNDDDAHDILVAWNDHRKLVASSWSWPAQFLMFLHVRLLKIVYCFDARSFLFLNGCVFLFANSFRNSFLTSFKPLNVALLADSNLASCFSLF